LLRDILESGFCGGYTPKTPRNLAKTRYSLDAIAASGKFDGFDQESVRIQLTNQHFVPYEDQPFFHKNLEGLLNNSGYFNTTDHEFTVESRRMDGTEVDIVFVVIWDRNTKGIIEPLYDFVSFQNYLPMHSLVAAYLMGLEKVSVDVISLMAGPVDTKTWAVDKPAINKLLVEWFHSTTDSGYRKSGSACMSCTRSGCTWKSDFDQRVYDWMKAQQLVAGLEAQIKEHVTYNGPTKVGAHMVYMKESRRRTADPTKRGLFLELLKEHRPNDWVAFMNPDIAAVTKLAEGGKVPMEIMDAFKESRFYTLDTKLTL
jgi:hypothetical protein